MLTLQNTLPYALCGVNKKFGDFPKSAIADNTYTSPSAADPWTTSSSSPARAPVSSWLLPTSWWSHIVLLDSTQSQLLIVYYKIQIIAFLQLLVWNIWGAVSQTIGDKGIVRYEDFSFDSLPGLGSLSPRQFCTTLAHIKVTMLS